MVDDVLLMKYMQGQCSEKETEEISSWIEKSEENRKAFRDAHHIYESVLMSVDPASLRMPAERKRHNRTAKMAAVLISAAASVAVAVLLAVHFTKVSDSRETVIAEVPAGKMMTLTLSDGTRVDLNSGARLTYPSVFYGKDRQVSLEGEALFHVTHDAGHPFTVHTFAASVEVLGTEFNVQAEEKSALFSASLVSGSVRVTDKSDPRQSFILVPNQTITTDGAGGFSIADRLDPQVGYWSEGLINIAGMPFDGLMRLFEKSFNVRIVIDRQEMPEIECTSGEIRISDGLDNALKILRHVADFDFTHIPGSNTVHIR